MRNALHGLGRVLAVGATVAVIALVYLFVITRGRPL